MRRKRGKLIRPPEALLIREETKEEIACTVSSLPPRARVYLCYRFGYPDDEEIAFSTNPLVANTGAATTIRYVYDDDDRLTAAYVGADGGASLTGWTSTGDPATATERAAHD